MTDYIFVKQRYRNQVQSSHSYPGANVDSDHVPVVQSAILGLRDTEQLYGKNGILTN